MTFQQNLLDWFEKNQRPLPWRKHYRPYEVWVSEIMLQQTQMETVLPYFDRWMKALPTLASLAKADEKKVLKLWEGLGYYSRARNIHRSAKEIMEKHGGLFPSDFETILSLKGVGRYTAGAIASIAFNQDKPIVDGNILRVLSRVYAVKKPVDVEKNKAFYWKMQEKLIPKGKARYFNQALMELGALVCTTQDPACAVCPLRNFCKTAKKGDPENYPVKFHKKKIVRVEAVALVLENKRRFLVRLRPVGGIMGGLWEFPEWKVSYGRGPNDARCKNGLSAIFEESWLQDSVPRTASGKADIGLITTLKRNYTHHLETLRVYHAVTDIRPVDPSGWKTAWASKKEFKRYPFSSAHAKIAQYLL